jgi:hypothetical protein
LQLTRNRTIPATAALIAVNAVVYVRSGQAEAYVRSGQAVIYVRKE